MRNVQYSENKAEPPPVFLTFFWPGMMEYGGSYQWCHTVIPQFSVHVILNATPLFLFHLYIYLTKIYKVLKHFVQYSNVSANGKIGSVRKRN